MQEPEARSSPLIEVRRIGAHEGQRLRAVRLAALEDTPSAFGSTLERELEFSEHEWASRATIGSAGEVRVTFVGDDGAELVGLVGAGPSTMAEGQIELVSMWTAPSARRTGVGRRLVEAVVDWARQRGADSVGLWVTRGNDPAHALYSGLGFVESGDVQPLPSDPCKDEIRMTRTV